MKKKILMVTSLLLICFFVGCGLHNYKLSQCKEVLRCLDESDAEGMKAMFCDKAIEGIPDLDEQINIAMDFFQGKTVSYSHILGGEGEAVDNGITTRHDISPHITDIETDAGKKYDIRFYSYIVNSSNPEKEGISEIGIYTGDGRKCIIGDFYLVNPEYLN